MKLIFTFFVIFLASTQAETTLPADYELQLGNILNDLEKLVQNVKKELKQLFSDILLEPLQQVDEVLQAIESRKEENEDCVNEQEGAINSTIELLYDNINVCGVNASKTSAQIAIDVSVATKQLTYDGLSILLTLRKCKKHKNHKLQKICYARLTVKVNIYLRKARKSIRTIKEIKTKRIPAVLTDTKACIRSAADGAVNKLDKINAEIDDCIGWMN